MGLNRSFVEFVHDEGYGDDLLRHINAAIRGKDMRADRLVGSSGMVLGKLIRQYNFHRGGGSSILVFKEIGGGVLTPDEIDELLIALGAESNDGRVTHELRIICDDVEKQRIEDFAKAIGADCRVVMTDSDDR